MPIDPPPKRAATLRRHIESQAFESCCYTADRASVVQQGSKCYHCLQAVSESFFHTALFDSQVTYLILSGALNLCHVTRLIWNDRQDLASGASRGGTLVFHFTEEVWLYIITNKDKKKKKLSWKQVMTVWLWWSSKLVSNWIQWQVMRIKIVINYYDVNIYLWCVIKFSMKKKNVRESFRKI